MADRKRIGIIGLGMIGGSLALALRDGCDVLGYDIDEKTRAYAEACGFCRVAEPSCMSGCDVIFVCVPIAVMAETLNNIGAAAGGAIVTDVASVKLPFKNTPGKYVGGHPMAGTERGGITAAKPHLFQNAYWALTGDADNAKLVGDVVQSIGALPIHMTAEDHDRAVAAFSHVPHAAAYALTSVATESGAPIAGSGFLDTTRIAQSDEGFWTEVFLKNAKNVSHGIRALISELGEIDTLINRADRAGLMQYLGAARKKRVALNHYDLGGEVLYVDLVDRVGEFERVTGAVARAGINVKNIALVPGREGASGALMLEFENAKDRQKAQEVLSKRG